MSDFAFLNKHRVAAGPWGSTPAAGFNGAFMFSIPGEARAVCVIASDNTGVTEEQLAVLGGWQHVSVSFGQASAKTPSWEIMCAVKDLFFEPEDCVVQFHPPRSEYVSQEQPTPPAILVGPRTIGGKQTSLKATKTNQKER